MSPAVDDVVLTVSGVCKTEVAECVNCAERLNWVPALVVAGQEMKDCEDSSLSGGGGAASPFAHQKGMRPSRSL